MRLLGKIFKFGIIASMVAGCTTTEQPNSISYDEILSGLGENGQVLAVVGSPDLNDTALIYYKAPSGQNKVIGVPVGAIQGKNMISEAALELLDENEKSTYFIISGTIEPVQYDPNAVCFYNVGDDPLAGDPSTLEFIQIVEDAFNASVVDAGCDGLDIPVQPTE